MINVCLYVFFYWFQSLIKCYMSLDLVVVQNIFSYHGHRSAVWRQPCWLGFSGLPPYKKHKSCTERLRRRRRRGWEEKQDVIRGKKSNREPCHHAASFQLVEIHTLISHLASRHSEAYTIWACIYKYRHSILYCTMQKTFHFKFCQEYRKSAACVKPLELQLEFLNSKINQRKYSIKCIWNMDQG